MNRSPHTRIILAIYTFFAFAAVASGETPSGSVCRDIDLAAETLDPLDKRATKGGGAALRFSMGETTSDDVTATLVVDGEAVVDPARFYPNRRSEIRWYLVEPEDTGRSRRLTLILGSQGLKLLTTLGTSKGGCEGIFVLLRDNKTGKLHRTPRIRDNFKI